ncbi:MAG: right-handed parallel beta-helix repeat-containing protein [Verrucomicrobia bacterium]|nr:right-handed parallel beta-helix repeat-containing protein [Verrucomicrobiota bacterium]
MRSWRLLLWIGCCLLPGGTVLAAAEAPPRWRLMAIGDSITEGGTSFSCYRPLLAEQLRAAGFDCEFVGSRGTAPLGHEGYGGKNVEFLAANVPARFAQHPADLVLLHAGHNHFAEERPVPGMIAATEKLIAGLRATNPRVVVLLAQVIPAGKLPKYSYLPELNAELARLAARLHAPGQPVVLVDQATDFDWRTDTVADLVHPNASGAAKMAARWFAALRPLVSAPVPAVTVVDVHVASSGDDTAPGTAARPVATLLRAQDLARRARVAGRFARVTVHAGTHYLPDTLVFTAEDADSAEWPTLWQAADGEQVVLSGGTRLALTWRPSPLGPGVFQAQVPPGLEIDELFLNGQRQWMARFPNRAQGEGLNVFDTWKLDHRAKPDPDRDPLAPGALARWADPTGAFLHAMHPALWGGVHWRVTGRNADGTLALEGGTQNNRGARLHGTYRFIENVREQLDAPGEWFHDRAQGVLHCFPPAGTDLTQATVETVRLRHLVEVRGTAARPVRGLQWRGFTFRHAARTFLDTREPMLRSDWTIYRGGAVVLTGTERCEIADCTFDQVGGNALFVSGYNRRLAVRRCEIHDAGASGICFAGDPATVRNALFRYEQRLDPAELDRTPGPRGQDFPADCLVEDCLITRTGRVEKQTAGVAIDMARAITIRHCSIYDVPRAGINLGGGTWGGHLIESCDVFDTVLETGDHGSFNSWGRDRFWRPDPAAVDALVAREPALPFLDAQQPTVIRHNRWRCDHGWDIDLDDGSSNYEIRDNLCLRGGIKLREGYRRVVENNLIPHSGLHPHVWYQNSGDIFRRNIVGSAAYLPARMGPPPWGAEMDHNLVHSPEQREPQPAARLAQQSGRDAHSLRADARFVDPARGDFRVREGSPTLALGFVNFAMDAFGVRPTALKAKARTPSFARPGTAEVTLAAPAARTWLGATVKTLATPEEASAAGVALAAGGAIVVSVPAGSAAARAGLQPGDLVIRAAGQAVRTAEDLSRTLRSGAPEGIHLRIVRNQAERELTLPTTP